MFRLFKSLIDSRFEPIDHDGQFKRNGYEGNPPILL